MDRHETGVEHDIEVLRREVKTLKQRNARVELNKRWETSWTRRLVICALTFAVVVVYNFTIWNDVSFWLASMVPVIGFFLSTLSLSFIRDIWERRTNKTAPSRPTDEQESPKTVETTGETMPEKKKISSDEFAERMGAYSHGYSVTVPGGTFVYTTGQIALDPDGNPVSVGDPAGQARYVFESLAKILEAGGACLDDVIKATVYVTDMAFFSQVSPVRNEYFRKSEPVSTLVEVSSLVHPDCVVEIEVVAFTPSS